MFIFNLNVVFTMNFLKMALSRVRFCPGFPPGAGFPGEEFVPAWLQLPLEHQKIREKLLPREILP
jgi:hypothetical protein